MNSTSKDICSYFQSVYQAAQPGCWPHFSLLQFSNTTWSKTHLIQHSKNFITSVPCLTIKVPILELAHTAQPYHENSITCQALATLVIHFLHKLAEITEYTLEYRFLQKYCKYHPKKRNHSPSSQAAALIALYVQLNIGLLLTCRGERIAVITSCSQQVACSH